MPASKAEQVLDALKALLETVPDAIVERNSALPRKVPDGGLIILRDGDPGEPEQALGGFTHGYYQHPVEIEVCAEEGAAAARDAAFDDLLQQIGFALDADTTLGGLAFGLTYGRPAASMPFNRCDLGSEQGLIDDPVLGQGRDPLAPLQDVITDDGDIIVPVDPRAAFADAAEPLLPATGTLARDEPEPGRKLPSRTEVRRIAHRRDQRGRGGRRSVRAVPARSGEHQRDTIGCRTTCSATRTRPLSRASGSCPISAASTGAGASASMTRSARRETARRHATRTTTCRSACNVDAVDGSLGRRPQCRLWGAGPSTPSKLDADRGSMPFDTPSSSSLPSWPNATGAG